jgi:hypothetical protein
VALITIRPKYFPRRFGADCACAREQDSEQPDKKRDHQRDASLSAVTSSGFGMHTYTRTVDGCPNKNSKTNGGRKAVGKS